MRGDFPKITAAEQGGKIAGDARTNLEIASGEKISTSENYLQEPEKEKRKRLKQASETRLLKN